MSAHARSVSEVLDAVEAVIHDDEIDLSEVDSPAKAKEAQLELVAHLRDQLCADDNAADAPIVEAIAVREWLREELDSHGVGVGDEHLDALAESFAARYVEREQGAEHWRERALKAEGWTGAEEADELVVGGADEPYVIIDTRSIVGNTPLWWMPNSGGYGSVISEIGRYSKAEAERKRPTDFPVPLRLAIECARPRVDIQLLNHVLQREGLPRPTMGWGHPPRCVDCERKANPRRRR